MVLIHHANNLHHWISKTSSYTWPSSNSLLGCLALKADPSNILIQRPIKIQGTPQESTELYVLVKSGKSWTSLTVSRNSKATACAEHSNKFRAASSLSVRSSQGMFPVRCNALTTSHLAYKRETNCCIQRSCWCCSEKGWAGGGRWVRAGVQAAGGHGQPLTPGAQARGPWRSSTGLGWLQPGQPWSGIDGQSHGSGAGLRSCQDGKVAGQGQGQQGAWQTQAQLKRSSGKVPDVKAAPRGKGEKVSRSFPTNLIPGYAAPPVPSWVEHWELTAQSGKEPHSLLVLSGSWHLLSAGMKNDEVFQEDLQGGGEAIKRNTQKRCKVRSKAMGTEAMERAWHWKDNQKCQRHQQNGERKATAEARTSRGAQNIGGRCDKTGRRWPTGETQWQPGCSSMDWEPTGWSRLKRGARRIRGSSTDRHAVYFLLPPVFGPSRWWFFLSAKCSWYPQSAAHVRRERLKSRTVLACPLCPSAGCSGLLCRSVRSQLQKPGEQPGPDSVRS